MWTEKASEAYQERKKEREKAGWGQKAGLVQFLWLFQRTSTLISGTSQFPNQGINISERPITQRLQFSQAHNDLAPSSLRSRMKHISLSKLNKLTLTLLSSNCLQTTILDLPFQAHVTVPLIVK